jgi:transcriptional regulator with XRE-family HTH domain
MGNGNNRIREWREARDLTLEQLAELSRISPSYLQRMETGGRNVSLKNLARISDALGVPANDLVVGGEAARVPVMGRIGAGSEIMPEFEQIPPDGLFEIETIIPMPDGVIAFEIDGDSMWPRYDPGDVVICWREGTPIQQILGDEAAVRTVDGRRFLKRVVQGSQPSTYDLESHNAAPIRGVRLEWVSRVGHVIRRGQWVRLNDVGKKRAIKKATR